MDGSAFVIGMLAAILLVVFGFLVGRESAKKSVPVADRLDDDDDANWWKRPKKEDD